MDSSPEIQFKGDSFRIFVKRFNAPEGHAPQTLKPSEKLFSGDALRFTMRAPSHGFLAVFGKDSTGEVQVLWPFNGKAPFEVSAGENIAPDAITVDSTLGTQQFTSVFSPQVFDLEKIATELKKKGTRDLTNCNACVVEQLEFQKGAP